ncbi:hypothetical protein [Methanosarcina sp. MSH10X1]|nr:hypothetical protein [Methanosarcina sp. MSH10X1]
MLYATIAGLASRMKDETDNKTRGEEGVKTFIKSFLSTIWSMTTGFMALE